MITKITTPTREIILKVQIEKEDEYQQRYWLTGLFYEYNLLDYIKKNQKSGNIIDIGSCIGNHTLFFSQIAKNVYSFEPIITNFLMQHKNLVLNDIKNVNLFNCALGEKNKIANIKDNRDTKIKTIYTTAGLHSESVFNWGSSHISDEKTGTKCIVKCLDDFNIEDVSIIKIDVEGYELNVLQGAKKTLKKYMPDLYIEITNKKQLTDILKFLAPIGYKTILYNNALKENSIIRIRGK